MCSDHSPAEASLRNGIRTGRNDDALVDAGAELDHGMQDLLEIEALDGARKWPAWKSLTLIAFVGTVFWAVVFIGYMAFL